MTRPAAHAVFVLAVFLALSPAAAQGKLPVAAGPVSTTCALETSEERTVTRVIDGHTLGLDGGGEVRLIGALAPDAFDTAGGAIADSSLEWPLALKARQALQDLVAGRSVGLAFSGRRTDRYGRLLAHAFVATGSETSAGPPPRTWIQGWLLQHGLARAYALDATAQCLTELIAHEAVARNTASGLWAEPAYTVRAAQEVTGLLRLTGTFQVVEGTIRAASDVRGTTYINFGEDFRQDFTVMLRQPARRALAAAGHPPDKLGGLKVRVRGWIERRGGPLIELLHPGALEMLRSDEIETPHPQPQQQAARRRSRRPVEPGP